MKGLYYFVICVGIFLLTSCASRVSSIKKDVDVTLAPMEGYLMLAVNTNFDLKEIRLVGKSIILLTSEDLKSGSNYILVNLPAGDYHVKNIKLGQYIFNDFEKELWSFQVKENVISYVGHLDMQSKGNFFRLNAKIQLLNKSSFALEYLEENFSNILSSRKIQYFGPGEDDFFTAVIEAEGVTNE